MLSQDAGRTIGVVELLIREENGWEELEDFQSAMADAPPEWGISLLWRAVGRGDVRAAQALLEDLGFDFDDGLLAVRLLAEPDDILSEYYRVWVRYDEG